MKRLQFSLRWLFILTAVVGLCLVLVPELWLRFKYMEEIDFRRRNSRNESGDYLGSDGHYHQVGDPDEDYLSWRINRLPVHMKKPPEGG
jgi:hypothetical protein